MISPGKSENKKHLKPPPGKFETTNGGIVWRRFSFLSKTTFIKIRYREFTRRVPIVNAKFLKHPFFSEVLRVKIPYLDV